MCFGQIITGDAFDDFLLSLSQDTSLGNLRFISRNFLLDEGINSLRRKSYEANGGVTTHASFDDWVEIHNDYLNSHIFLVRPLPLPNLLDVADEAYCPETFRCVDSFSTFGAADLDLYLIRVERAEHISRLAGLNSVDELLELARKVETQNLSRVGSTTNQSTKEEQLLNSVLELWGRSLDMRPVWAGFWENFAELFGSEPASDSEAWSDELRDRLGLYHLNPFALSVPEIPILIFRYPVKILPRLKDNRTLRPITVPTVLDSRFCEAFCPAPRGQSCGFTVYLGHYEYQSQREILHPPIQFKSEHLFRVGLIKRSLPSDLSSARSLHLLWLRLETGRHDYSVITDGD